MTAALEALAAGDVREAEAILQAAGEDEPSRRWEDRGRDVRCSFCPQTFRWPGERDKHEVLFHTLEEAA